MSQTIETCHYRFGAWEWPSPPGESPGRHRLRPGLSQEERGLLMQGMTGKYRNIEMAMDQYLLIPFLVGWTSVYQLFWWSPGVQGFDTLPNEYWLYNMVIYLTTRIVEWNIVYIYIYGNYIWTYGLSNIWTGILDYLRKGFPWYARPFKLTESNSFKYTVTTFKYTNWYCILPLGPRGLDDSGNYSIVHNIAMEAMVSVRCPL